MKALKIFFAVAGLLSLQGCLVLETVGIKILLRPNDDPLLTMEYGNVYSVEDTEFEKDIALRVRKDFEELILEWKDEQPRKGWEETGLKITNREVFIQRGKVMGRISGVATNLENVVDALFSVQNGERIVNLELKEESDPIEVVETNGEVRETNGETFIVWPEDATELYYKLKFKLADSYPIRQPLFLKLLEDYLASQEKTPSGAV